MKDAAKKFRKTCEKCNKPFSTANESEVLCRECRMRDDFAKRRAEDTVYRERYVSAIFECTCDTSDGQSARTHLGHTYKKTGMIRAPFKVVAIDT